VLEKGLFPGGRDASQPQEFSAFYKPKRHSLSSRSSKCVPWSSLGVGIGRRDVFTGLLYLSMSGKEDTPPFRCSEEDRQP